MPDVFRRARKDVHRAIDGGARLPFEINPCNLDPGGKYGPEIPDGPRCAVCFAGFDDKRHAGVRGPVSSVPRRRPGRKAATVGGAAAIALAAIVLASSGVTLVAPLASPTAAASSLALPTSVVGPSPSSTAASSPSLVPAPTVGPVVIPPVPRPTVRPSPEPTPCPHPGRHIGLADPCKWHGG